VPLTFDEDSLPEGGINYEGDLPTEPGWYLNAAFARTIGPLDNLSYIEAEIMALLRYLDAYPAIRQNSEHLEVLSGGAKPGSHIDWIRPTVTGVRPLE
jgi:hypothetical protein